MPRPDSWLVQWADGAGIHDAHISDLNGATTLMAALRHVGGFIPGTLGLFEVYPERTVRVQ